MPTSVLVAFRWSAVLVIGLIVACGDAPAPASTTTDTTQAAGDTSVLTSDIPTDVGSGDSGTADTDGPIGWTDCNTPGTHAQPAGPGCPCISAEDCETGWCVPTSEVVNRCTTLCIESCPNGWQCTPLTTPGGDITFLCTESDRLLCRPCLSNSDCSANTGSSNGFCVDYGGSEGHFCGTVCDDDHPCPMGYDCEGNLTASDGTTIGVNQCVRQEGLSCECTAKFSQEAATTECGHGVSDACTGTRVCASDGTLTDCSAPEPTTEVCNGKDDDCDGVTDQSLAGLCDDLDPCTTDTCSDGVCTHDAIACDDNNVCTADSCGSEGCVFTPLVDTPCSDDNACTADDRCAEGTCVPGAAMVCDDDNACTADDCDPNDGCTSEPAQDGAACSTESCVFGVCADGSCSQATACEAQGALCTPNGCVDPANVTMTLRTVSLSGTGAPTTPNTSALGAIQSVATPTAAGLMEGGAMTLRLGFTLQDTGAP